MSIRTPREIPIADHLWTVLGKMADEMGSDRAALVNEALHAFARMNGYVVPGAPGAEREASTPAPGAPPPARRSVAEEVLETAERLERDIAARPPPVPVPAVAGGLVIEREDGTQLRVAKDRFVIGRGGHCDLVIDGAKVSREHAAIVREPDGWWIEDLGSSNGTWLRRERVGRRKIEDGDEYYLCAERLRCALR